MPDFEVDLYGAVSSQARFVALWWDERPIPQQHEMRLGTILGDLPDSSGVYAITGRHDAHSGGGVLYIGQASRLRTRVLRSAECRLLEINDNDEVRMCADVWDLTIRWARLSDELLDSVERLLIMSHMPPFNSQQVSDSVRREGPRESEVDLVVMNAGRKGPLLPIVAGQYQSGWSDIHDRPLGP
jgi:hypothetical protein